MTEHEAPGATPDTAADDRQPVLEARGLVKRFGRVTALSGADLELYPGEVLAVIGDNGAGKSSLIKCLAGAMIPDEGEMYLNGEQVSFKGPPDAQAVGIETVYQTLAVAPALDIAENMFLGREKRVAAHSAACCARPTSAACDAMPRRRSTTSASARSKTSRRLSRRCRAVSARRLPLHVQRRSGARS